MFDSNNKVLLVEIIDEELQKNNFINFCEELNSEIKKIINEA